MEKGIDLQIRGIKFELQWHSGSVRETSNPCSLKYRLYYKKKKKIYFLTELVSGDTMIFFLVKNWSSCMD